MGRPRINAPHKFYIDMHTAEGGQVAVYKTPKSGSIWQSRVYVGAERRYRIKSTKTADFATAMQFAKDRYYEGRQAKKQGNTAQLWSPPFSKVVDEFIAWLEEQIKAELRPGGPLKRFKNSLNWWKKYMGADTFTAITAQRISGFAVWRQENSKKKLAITTLAVLVQHERRHGFVRR